MDIINDYFEKLDNNKRITLRNTDKKYFKVQVFQDGTVILIPQDSVKLSPISENTYNMILSSLENLKKGIVSDPIDASMF